MFASCHKELCEEITIRHSLCPGCRSGKESICQCMRHGFDPWIGKIPLAKEMTIHSSILAWEIPWIEEPGELQAMGSQKSWIQLKD